MVRQCTFSYDFLADVPGVPTRLKDVEFPFFCMSCGFYPSQIAVDGNRKCSVRVSGDQVHNFHRTSAPIDVDAAGRAMYVQAFTAAKATVTPPAADCSMLRTYPFFNSDAFFEYFPADMTDCNRTPQRHTFPPSVESPTCTHFRASRRRLSTFSKGSALKMMWRSLNVWISVWQGYCLDRATNFATNGHWYLQKNTFALTESICGALLKGSSLATRP